MPGHNIRILMGFFAFAPVAEPGETLQKFLSALVREMLQPELERIRAEARCDLVQKGLVGEGVLQPARRSEISIPNTKLCSGS